MNSKIRKYNKNRLHDLNYPPLLYHRLVDTMGFLRKIQYEGNNTSSHLRVCRLLHTLSMSFRSLRKRFWSSVVVSLGALSFPDRFQIVIIVASNCCRDSMRHKIVPWSSKADYVPVLPSPSVGLPSVDRPCRLPAANPLIIPPGHH